MGRRKAAEKCTILPWLSRKSDNSEGRFIQVGNSLLLKNIKAVEHIRMPKEEQIIEGINLAAETINELAIHGHYSDYRAILNAVQYHAHSLDSRAEENQLLDLWAIFESVLDISNKHTSDRINQICDYLVFI